MKDVFTTKFRPDEILSKYQCGFRKGFNAHYCQLSMIEKCKESVDNGGAFGALMTDLSKVFDCLLYGLLIAKPNAYGFDIKSGLIQQYPPNRKQRVKKFFIVFHRGQS